jgi:hypothetical protein
MPVWITIIIALLLVSTAGNLVYYGAVLFRVLSGAARVPTLRRVLERGGHDAGEASRLCAIVPAHNEEGSIGRLAASLRDHDHPRLRVVFALDRCTDGTERALLDTVGDDPRFELIAIDRCPADWAGKVHAMHAAVERADGVVGAELLLFADADTWLEPGALRAAEAYLRRERLDLLSLLPTLTADDPWEKHAQPACGFELVRQYPLDRVNSDHKRRAFANGQFMLFTRDAYDAVGGHAAVKDELLEDIALARLMADQRGMRVGCLIADGLVWCKMYGSREAFRRGWKRIFTEAARRNPTRLRKHAGRVLITGAGLPSDTALCLAVSSAALAMYPESAIALAATLTAGVSLAVFVLAMSLVYRAQRVPLRCVASYPLAAWRCAGVLTEAADDLDSGRETEWGGRSYRREARSAGGGGR